MTFTGADGLGFHQNGRHYRVTGANCYYLGFAPDRMVLPVFETAAAMRLNTLRTWAFWHGDPPWPMLDRTLALAEERGMRLILTLVNYWTDFGGMTEWCSRFGLRGQAPFFTDGAVRASFRAHIEGLLGRENTVTGRKYRDEPAILAWELANEPRVPGGAPEVLRKWAAEMSGVVKQAGARQLVALGDEGYFHRRRAGRNRLYNGSHGVDHEALLGIATLDFATCHLYPGFDEGSDPAELGVRWIREHAAAAVRAGKPVLLEEYGAKVKGPERDRVFARWLAEVEEHPHAGSLLWMLAGPGENGEPYYDDGYTVYSAAELPSLVSHAAGRTGN